MPGSNRSALHDDAARLTRALEVYLHSCYGRRSAARASEFAALLGKSRSYLARLFRRLLGRTMLEAMRERQVEHAEQLLRTTKKPTREIALAAGFGTQATFHRVFSSLRAMTPDEYRERFTK